MKKTEYVIYSRDKKWTSGCWAVIWAYPTLKSAKKRMKDFPPSKIRSYKIVKEVIESETVFMRKAGKYGLHG